MIILDGKPFSLRREIDLVEARVAERGARLVIVHCTAPVDIVRQRLRAGLTNPRNVRAERTPEKADRIRQEFEPLDRPHLELDTATDIDQAVDAVERYIKSIPA